MVKVIASSVRKGNVLDLDGKLAVVMHAENIHPGKGTPVTHLEMRRIADGVKVAERYRTTDQVERAYLDEKDYNYLYEDDMGYNFMHPETFDQITMSEGCRRRSGAVAAGRHDVPRVAARGQCRSRSSCRSASRWKSSRPTPSSKARPHHRPTSRRSSRTAPA